MKRTSDPIHLLKIANPVPDPDRLPDEPESLMEEIIAMARTNDQTKNRFRRPLMLSTAAVAVVLAGAAAWAIMSPEQTTNLACNGESIIGARSGDPVADCADEMRRQGHEPINLVAYVNDNGAVGVFEQGGEIPSSWHPLEDGFRQDTTIIELRGALDDVATGVESGCFSDDEAIAIVERELATSGLDWEIATRSGEGLTPPTCAVAIVLAEDEQVLVAQIEVGAVPTEADEADQPWIALADQLNQALDDECMNLNDAARAAIAISRDVGAEYMTQIDVVDEPEASCTTADVTVGGIVFVVLRGPADGPIDPIDLPKAD